MRLLFLLSLAVAYRIETVTTTCFLMVNKECFKYHATEVEAAINKTQNYISHTTTTYKYGAASMITYKY